MPKAVLRSPVELVMTFIGVAQELIYFASPLVMTECLIPILLNLIVSV